MGEGWLDIFQLWEMGGWIYFSYEGGVSGYISVSREGWLDIFQLWRRGGWIYFNYEGGVAGYVSVMGRVAGYISV